MVSLITIAILIVVFYIYYCFTKIKYRKYDNSPVNKRIDLIYSKWYKKSAYLLNRNNTTVYEIDKLLYHLKKELINVGISKGDIEAYIKMLKSNVSIQFGVKDALIGVLTFVTTNSFVTEQVEANKKQIFQMIDTYFSNSENVNQTLNVFFVLLAIIFMVAIVWVIFTVTTIDTIHKKNQRLFTLNGLLKMWNYDENKEVKKIEEIDKSKDNTVYVNLKFGKSKSDEFLDSSLGEEVYQYFNVINDKIVNLLNKFSDKAIGVIKFVIAFFISNLIGLILSLTASMIALIWTGVINTTPFIWCIMSLFLLIIIVPIFMIYFSMFKSIFEKYKKKSTIAGIIYSCLSIALYVYVAFMAKIIDEILLFSIPLPILVIILSVLWSPAIETSESH